MTPAAARDGVPSLAAAAPRPGRVRAAGAALTAVIVLAVPLVVAGNAAWLLVNPWLVHAQYALPGFPDDRLGLTADQRSDLAVIGVRSVRPLDARGPDLLRSARLPAGGPAFDARETAHMEDVRGLVGAILVAWAAALAAGVVAAVAVRRIAGPAAVARALTAGAFATLALAGIAGLAMLVDFEGFFDAFHGLFFTGDTWRFAEGDTLRNLYPDRFWGVAGAFAAALVVMQSVALAGGVSLWRRRQAPDGGGAGAPRSFRAPIAASPGRQGGSGPAAPSGR